jgi:hypothetical protein
VYYRDGRIRTRNGRSTLQKQMRLKLSDWASIAEIASSVAVVVTLVVLILEVRGNTDAIQASNRQSIAARTEAMALANATSPDLAEILASGPQNVAQQIRLAGYFTAILRNAEEAYLQFREGRLPEDYFARRVEAAIGVLNLIPGGWEGWLVRSSSFDPGFVEYVDDNLGTGGFLPSDSSARSEGRSNE